jgi:hypothetical protein
MAGYPSRQVQQWDSESAFSIGNPDKGGDFTCIGFAPSQKRRCRNPIAAHNQKAAREILNQLSRMHPLDVSDTETSKLKTAVRYALCRRYHQDQVDEVVREWKEILRAEATRQPGWRRVESSEERVASRNHRRLPSHDGPVMGPLLTFPSTSSSTRSRSGSQQPRQRNSRHNGVNDRLSHVIDDMEDVRTMTYLTETIHEPRRQAPSAPASVEEEEQQLPVRAPELQQQSVSKPARQQTCSVTHMLRRSVDEDCIICTMPMVNCLLSELVWCKKSCGRSMHKDCFKTMRGYVVVTRCVFW